MHTDCLPTADRQTRESLLDPSCQSGKCFGLTILFDLLRTHFFLAFPVFPVILNKFTSYAGYQFFAKIDLCLQHIPVIQRNLFISPFIAAPFQAVFMSFLWPQ